jgi:hypothetical protein
MTYHTLSKHDFRIILAWLPGHLGISGNEAADSVARDVIIQGALVPGVLSLDFKTALCWCIMAKWQQDWDHT